MARRILHERAARSVLAKEIAETLWQEFGNLSASKKPQIPTAKSLQLLWTLHCLGELTKRDTSQWTTHADDTIRGWMVRLGLENKSPSAKFLAALSELSKADSSSYVRLQLASGLQRLPLASRTEIAKGLVAHAEDAADNNLVLMTWYGIEPMIAQGDDNVLPLAVATKIPKLREFIARHLASGAAPRFAPILRWLEEQNDDVAIQRDILKGAYAAIEGRRDLKPDQGWKSVSARYASSADPVVREFSQRISLVQGSDEAFAEFVKIVKNDRLDAAQRERALADLVTTRRPGVADLLLDRLNDSALRATAIRGLAGFDRIEVGQVLLSLYAKLSDSEKLDAISTMTAREKTALTLVTAVESGGIDKRDLSEFDIRQLQRFKEAKLKELVNKLFGAKPSSVERANQIAEMKKQVLAGNAAAVSVSNGRTLFQKNCASCHTLFGDGRQVGPDLTGAQRTDLDYVLINVMDPSALVGHAYRVTIVELKDGRVINGIVKAEDASTLTLQTATDRVVVATQDIEERQQQSVSMMPEGLLNRLSIQDIRDLVKYLGSSPPK